MYFPPSSNVVSLMWRLESAFPKFGTGQLARGGSLTGRNSNPLFSRRQTVFSTLGYWVREWDIKMLIVRFLIVVFIDGWMMNGWMDGWLCLWMDGWMVMFMDGWKDEMFLLSNFPAPDDGSWMWERRSLVYTWQHCYRTLSYKHFMFLTLSTCRTQKDGTFKSIRR